MIVSEERLRLSVGRVEREPGIDGDCAEIVVHPTAQDLLYQYLAVLLPLFSALLSVRARVALRDHDVGLRHAEFLHAERPPNVGIMEGTRFFLGTTRRKTSRCVFDRRRSTTIWAKSGTFSATKRER